MKRITPSPYPYHSRKKKRKHGATVLFCAFIVSIAIFVLAVFTQWGIGGVVSPHESGGRENTAYLNQSASAESEPSTQATKPRLSPLPALHSSHAVLVALNDNHDVLLDIMGDERIYPASMTKIMTAVIVLEKIKNLDTEIILRQKTFDALDGTDSSVAGFLQGEKVRAIDLLYGLMLPSGGECAIGLAEYVSGSESTFADLMNQKAHQLNMNGTHFTNSTGLHDNNHYSTAKDIALLVEYAIQNDIFYKIFTAEGYSTKPTNLHTDGITFYRVCKVAIFTCTCTKVFCAHSSAISTACPRVNFLQ